MVDNDFVDWDRFEEAEAFDMERSEQEAKIARLEAELERLRSERRWIPVTERLPEEDVHVLAWHDSDECCRVAYRHYGIWNTVGYMPTQDVCIFVTHWMPLPAPPAP